MAKQVATTQRAYTLRLQGAAPLDQSWRDALWLTHEAVNKGAKAFGDWLLTLRGGLDHNLADVKTLQGRGKLDRDPTDDERKARRILLALSWLSVESERGAPTKHFVPRDMCKQSVARSNWKTVEALKEILKKRGLGKSEIDAWVQDCSASLTAAIRDDTVWVNRSKAFDVACNGQDVTKAREDSRALLWFLLGDDYLKLPRKAKKPEEKAADTEGEASDEDISQEKRSAVIQSGKGAGQRTRHPFSHIFGGKKDSRGFGKPPRQLALREHWKTHLKPPVEASGIPMRDAKAGKKDGVSPTELHREMFSKAASRLAQIHTKQKQQEVERQNRKAADEALKALEADAQCKLALDLLDALCVERGTASGAREECRIRPRQIDGWDRVVKAWEPTAGTSDPTAAEEQRIEAAKRLQDEDSDEKFGDINLFMALAEEKCKAVWWHANAPKPEILKTYVKGKKARADAVRLKVAAFRHPDPHFNPVFCQFGVSRPRIEFRRLRDFTAKPEGRDVRAVGLLLWDDRKADLHVLHAVSKRLDREVGAACDSALKGAADLVDVARRSRLSIATVAQLPGKEGVRVAHVFDRKKVKARKIDEEGAGTEGVSEPAREKEPEWNGTLLGERRALEAIGRLLGDGKQTEAEKCRRRLHWRLIVSLEMRPQGPWLTYGEDKNLLEVRHDRQQKENVVVTTPRDSRDEWRGLAFPFWHPCNEKGRKGMAKHLLSRLVPGLRVLSVDLGHRYAAACAVWETLNAKQAKEDCKVAGHEPPKDDDLYLHLKNGNRTGVYRRIGADSIEAVDRGTGEVKTVSHPAPWARLDRQFLIKLQGEDEEARKASPAEVVAAQELEKEVGREPLDQRSLRVDDLMSETVRAARLALQRHGRCARIAFNLTASKKLLPGSREEALTDEGRVELLADTLADWYALFTGKGWTDEWAKPQWETHVTPLLQGTALPQIPEDAEATPKTRKKYRADLAENLKPVAESLAKNDSLCRKLHCLWATHWRENDVTLRKRLRRLRDWILPRGKKAEADCAIRHVGGLSLTRIATVKSLYQVQKAFHMRAEPEDLRKNIPSKGDDALVDFGRSILDVMEHMREQRVKQLASRIAEAALGIGRMKRFEGGKDPARPRARVDQPCHAVVIENLTHYRPEETRTRRENRQLMSWSSSEVKECLAEACQLSGLHLREVQAGYTSRQDSRTGAPGVRCQDVPVKEFMRSPFWRKQVAQAEKKQAEGRGDARERFLCGLNAKWKDEPAADWEKAGAVRVPVKGGEIFVSADAKSPAAKGLQADLNAAANIGLKALADPDWPGRWWYVPCDPTAFKPAAYSGQSGHRFRDQTGQLS
ncbi:MAG: type V CRISPR-associated protein Cas12b, partial [Verrucomicrobiota bacterium]|nr:type V CRISPR-associated protein Cas12b [Verrucomicrobiota bacterium]